MLQRCISYPIGKDLSNMVKMLQNCFFGALLPLVMSGLDMFSMSYFLILLACSYKILSSEPPGAKQSPLFLWHNFNDFMEKEPCTKFCSVLISSHEVMKLESFESDMSGIIHTNIQKNFILGFLCIFFLVLWEKSIYTVL